VEAQQADLEAKQLLEEAANREKLRLQQAEELIKREEEALSKQIKR